MKYATYPFVVILLLTISTTVWAADERADGWSLARERDGVSVFLRDVDGFAIREFRGVATMRASVEQLLALYLDAGRCADWVPNCKSAELIETIGDAEWIVRTELNSPWPTKNRDYVLRVVRSDDEKTGATTLTFMDVKDYSEQRCCVRMSRFQGYWKFKPVQGEKEATVQVTYQNHFNPGGGFPAALVNAAIAGMPFDTLTNMRNLVEGR
jgi:hypothetical protein